MQSDTLCFMDWRGITWWYGFRAGVDLRQGEGPLGTRYYWTPTPPVLTSRYLLGSP